MNYNELKEAHSKEMNDFPIAFAFSKSQLADALIKLGAKDTSEICTVGGTGGLILKTDSEALSALFIKHNKEREEALLDDEYLKQAFDYELSNHEYGITCDIEPTLDAIGIEYEEYESNERIKAIGKKAIKEHLRNFNC